MLSCWGITQAQFADPAITGATFTPNTIETGQNSTLEISFSNTGSTAIPASSIEVTISTANSFYTSDGTTAPGGSAGALFNWIYLGSDIWRGRNNSAIDAFSGGIIELVVTGIGESPGFEATNINVQPVASFGDFQNESSNDNLQPSLKVVAGSGVPCESVGGIGAACTDAYGNASTIGNDCNCIDLGPCLAAGGVGAPCTDTHGNASTIGNDCNCIDLGPCLAVGGVGAPCQDSDGDLSTIGNDCNCIEVIDPCVIGDPCTDSDGDASTLNDNCDCIEIDNGVGEFADPAVTGASYDPNIIEVGEVSELTISFSNTGSTAIPANSIELTISTPTAFYYSDGVNPPAGPGGALFSWTYLGFDIWRGVNTVVIPAFGGGDITLLVEGFVVSPGFEATNINVQPVANFGAFDNEVANDNLQPTLKVVPKPIDCNTQGPEIGLVSKTDPSCFGASDGALEIEHLGAYPITSVQWVGGPASETYANIPAGTYTVNVVDANGCTASESYSLVNPDELTVNTVIENEDCLNFGSVTLNISGGTPPYSSSGDLSASTTDNVFENLVAGSYVQTVEDANGCTQEVTIIIGNDCGCTDADKDGVCTDDDCDDTDPSITYGPGDPCDDGDDCTINDTIDNNCNCKGEDPPAIELVGVPDDITVECDNIPTPPVVTAGGFTVTFDENRTDGGNCIDEYVLIRSWEARDNCGNVAAAVQIITVEDNTPPVLNGVPADITINANVGETLPADNVTATDNCDTDVEVFLATPTIVPDPCSNMITYSRSWTATDNCGNTATAKQTITVINDGFIVDTDGDGVCDPDDVCPGFDDNIDSNNNGTPDGCENCDGSLTIGGGITRYPECAGDNKGKIEITVSGGAGGLQVEWADNGSNALIRDNLPAGDYTVTLSDVIGCQVTKTFTITEPIPIIVVAGITPESCTGNDGAIDISVAGGTPPYTYNWLLPLSTNTEDVSGLSAGNYTVRIEDANNCKVTETFTVEDDCQVNNVCDAQVIVESNGIRITGLNDPVTQIWVQNTGTGQFVFSCSDFTNPCEIPEQLIPLIDGNYIVYVQTFTFVGGYQMICDIRHPFTISTTCPDADNDTICDPDDQCPGEDDRIDTDKDGTPDCLDQCPNDPLKIVPGDCGCGIPEGTCNPCDGSLKVAIQVERQISCAGGSNGKLLAVASGGTPPYQYTWNDNSTGQYLDGIPAGTYSVTVKDAQDCTATISITLGEPSPIVITGVVIDAGCDPNTGSIDISVSGGTGSYTYWWSLGGQITQDISGLNPGTYTVRVKDQNDCVVTETFTVGIDCVPSCNNLTDGGQIGFDSGCLSEESICPDDPAPIINSCIDPSGGSGALEIIWLRSTTSCVPPTTTIADIANDPNWEIIPGATGLSYVPGNLTETTCFLRCSRRAGCDTYTGESNIVRINIKTDCGGTGDPNVCDLVVSNTGNSISIKGLDEPNVAVEVFSGYFGTQIYSCLFNEVCPLNVNLPGLAPGKYLVKVRTFNANWQPVCIEEIWPIVLDGGSCEDDDGDGVCNPQDQCPGFNDNIDTDNDGIPDGCDNCIVGAPCDDGQANTINDQINANCECKGEVITDPCYGIGDDDGDGICNDADQCPGSDDNQDSDGDGQPDGCDPCPFDINDDSDGDGICDSQDRCPGSNDNIDQDNDGIPDGCDPCDNRLAGTSCDDGNANTINDVYDANCNCAGTPVNTDPDCDDLQLDGSNGQLVISGLTAPTINLIVFKVDQFGGLTNIFGCNGNCNAIEIIPNLSPGTYRVDYTFYKANYSARICEDSKTVQVTSGAASGRASSKVISSSVPNFSVYPNPATDEVFIDMKDWKGKQVDVRIFNHLTQPVFEKYIEKVSGDPERVQTKHFTNGMYIVQLHTKGELPVTRKLLISRLY